MVLKVDLEKAYDRVRWDFLLETLTLAGHPPNLVKVIMQCQAAGSTELRWNSKVAGYFKASRGVRQGDPLSPFGSLGRPVTNSSSIVTE